MADSGHKFAFGLAGFVRPLDGFGIGLFRFFSQLDVAGNANHAERRIVFRVVQCLDGFKVYPFPIGIQHLFLADQGIEFSPHDLKVVLNKFLSGIS